eukprot:scaffold1388_cov390-Prasinococcus_capsulatus_cf.AAC.18
MACQGSLCSARLWLVLKQCKVVVSMLHLSPSQPCPAARQARHSRLCAAHESSEPSLHRLGGARRGPPSLRAGVTQPLTRGCESACCSAARFSRNFVRCRSDAEPDLVPLSDENDAAGGERLLATSASPGRGPGRARWSEGEPLVSLYLG